jgi:hypothetical protein
MHACPLSTRSEGGTPLPGCTPASHASFPIGDTMRDPHPIEVLIAKAHGRPVKSLARWGTRWYPGRDDRSQVLMGRWMVPDPEDRVAQIDAAPGTRGGEWVPTDIPPYWTEMAEAWPLWSEVATLAGTFSGADGYAILEFAEGGGARERDLQPGDHLRRGGPGSHPLVGPPAPRAAGRQHHLPAGLVPRCHLLRPRHYRHAGDLPHIPPRPAHRHPADTPPLRNPDPGSTESASVLAPQPNACVSSRIAPHIPQSPS